MDYWETIVWPDEAKIELFGCHSTHRVWRINGTAHHPRNTISTVKFGGGSIMVRGSFSANGTGRLHIFEDRMNGEMYQDILDKNLLPSNDPKHKEIINWFQRNKIKLLEWPNLSRGHQPNQKKDSRVRFDLERKIIYSL